MRIKSWALATRPKTLPAAIVPVMVATSLVYFEGHLNNLWLSLFALMGAVFIQIATNFFNDAIDFKKGADTSERIGPKRLTQSGDLSYKQIMFAAIACCFVALGFGIPLVLNSGWPLVVIGLVSLFMAYSYTGGPFPLAYLGLGDLFVILFFGLIAVGGVYFIHTGEISTTAIVAGLQIGFLSTVLIAINNLRDVEQDKKVNKNTLAVKFGKSFVRFEILFLYLLAICLGAFWYMQGAIWAAFAPALALPIIIALVFKVFNTPPSAVYNSFLARSALVLISFSLLLSLGFVLQ